MLNSWPLPHHLIAIPHPSNPVKCNTGLGEIDKSFTRLYSNKITDKTIFQTRNWGNGGSHTEQWGKGKLLASLEYQVSNIKFLLASLK